MVNRLKSVDSVVMKFGRMLLLLLLVGAVVAWAISWYAGRQSEAARKLLLESASPEREYRIPSGNASIHLRTSMGPTEYVRYDFSFVCREGFQLRAQTRPVPIRFVDARKFEIHRMSFADVTRGCVDGTDGRVCTSLSGAGSFHLDVEQYLRITEAAVNDSSVASPNCSPM